MSIDQFKAMTSNLPWFVWVLLGVMVVSFIVVRVIPAFRTVKEGVQAFAAEDYKRNPQAPGLAPERQRGLNVGAIIGEQNSFFVDSLQTGIEKGELKQRLAQFWGVVDGNSAREAIERMLSFAGTKLPDAVLEVRAADPQNWRAAAAAKLADHPDASETIDHLGQTINLLTKQGIVANPPRPETAAGWDLGRAVFLARASFDLGYIDESKAWAYIDAAVREAQARFGDWQSLGNSYLIGRALWFGKNEMLESLIELGKGVMNDAKSPWQSVSLR